MELEPKVKSSKRRLSEDSTELINTMDFLMLKISKMKKRNAIKQENKSISHTKVDTQ
jgi:hypothetical protein